MKSIALPVLGLVLAGCAATGTRNLARLLAVHDDHPVQVAAMVVDLDTGETLFAREAKRLFRPASTMKLLTTAAVCRRAPDGVLATSLSASDLPEGVLTLAGGGDPFLSAEDVRGLVRQLRAQGLERAAGEVRVADPLLGAARFGEGWMWDDEPATFMPTISAAAVDGGCVTVEVRGTESGPEAQLLPVAGSLQCEVLAGDGPLRVTRGRYRTRERVTVTGSLDPSQVVRRRISVPDPAQLAGFVLVDALRGEGALVGDPGVVVEAAVRAGQQPRLQVRVQRAMAEVIRRTNKDSDNLGAELLLRQLGALGDERVPLGPDAARAGIAVIAADIERLGLDAAGYRIADGSGVSHYNLVSAELLVRLLVDMHQLGGRGFEVFSASLPIAGRDGTLSSRMRGTAAEQRVRAKTGTVSGVSNLAGYVETTSGRHLAFAILVQNFVGSSRPWRAVQDRMCVLLSGL